MSSAHTCLEMLLADLLLLGALAPSPARAQTNDDSRTQLPPELQGAKVYHLPEETRLGAPVEDLIIYRDLAYQGIDLEGLTLNLFVSIKRVDRAATVRRIYFQDVRANGIPVHVEPFAQEFKLSKKEVVDLPAPLKCAIAFPDLDSLKPVQDVVTRDTIRITGESFVEVKLNALEKLALRSKRLVLPIQLDQQVPLHLFSENPLLQMTANKILDTLSDPTSTVAVRLAKEHLEKLARDRTTEALGRASVYLLYCEYTLRDPKTGAAEKFSEIGTGFVVSVHGKLLTAKRVIQPWKFDPQIAFLVSHEHLDLDQKTYKVWAWPADIRVLTADGQPDFENALSTDQQTLKVLKTAPDRAESREHRDTDSGASGRVTLQAPGENDVALLQLTGNNFHVLALADPGMELSQALAATLLGFPFGLSQARNNLQLVFVNATRQGTRISLDHQLNPGESGAPLLAPDGKVVGMADESNECTPVAAWRALIP